MEALPAPAVTCVIIFHNEHRFLGEAIESVLAQTFEDWELLLVDDGSTDGSNLIARAHAAANPAKVRSLCHPGRSNCGKSATRNLGLQCARGELVAFLDGDDVWLPGKLERQVALFREYPEARMVCGATDYWHSWDPAAGRQDILIHTGQTRDAAPFPQDCLFAPGELVEHFYPLGPGTTTSQSGYMIRRRFAQQLGGFDSSFTSLFDLLVLTKVHFDGAIYISSECFDRYRQHAASSSHMAGRAEWGEAKLRYLEWLRGYCKARGYDNPRVLRAIRQQMLRYRHPLIWRAGRRVARGVRELAGRA